MSDVVVDGGREAVEGLEAHAKGDALETDGDEGVGLQGEEEVDRVDAAVGDVVE